MINKIILIFFLMTSVLYSQRVLRTDFPYINNSKLLCAVTKDDNSGYYYYSYAVVNGIGNKGDIDDFEIDLTRFPNTIDIDTVGLIFFNKYNEWIEHNNRRGYQLCYGKITPVGFPVLPNKYWDGSIGNKYRFAGFFGDTLTVPPGDTLRDFVMMSKGIPGLRCYKIRPEFSSGEYVLTEEEDTNMAITQTFVTKGDTVVMGGDTIVTQGDTVVSPKQPRINRGNIDSVEQSLAVNGLIVGPISPPIFFDAIRWCDTLTSYTNQSRRLGWIKDDAGLNKYNDYFSIAKVKLTQHDSAGARTVLQKVLKDVDIDSTSGITSEAYALLKFNTEYLIKHLLASPTK